MLETLDFAIGTRGEKWHAVWRNAPDGQMEGPARETKQEALRDIDNITSLAKRVFRKLFPHCIINVGRVQ
jgi:hypothetical protein